MVQGCHCGTKSKFLDHKLWENSVIFLVTALMIGMVFDNVKAYSSGMSIMKSSPKCLCQGNSVWK